jgi:hypothetical protein
MAVDLPDIEGPLMLQLLEAWIPAGFRDRGLSALRQDGGHSTNAPRTYAPDPA